MNFSITTIDILRHIFPGGIFLAGFFICFSDSFLYWLESARYISGTSLTLLFMSLIIIFIAVGPFVRMFSQLCILYPYRKFFNKSSGFKCLFKDPDFEEELSKRINFLFGELKRDINIFMLSHQWACENTPPIFNNIIQKREYLYHFFRNMAFSTTLLTVGLLLHWRTFHWSLCLLSFAILAVSYWAFNYYYLAYHRSVYWSLCIKTTIKTINEE